ncbi:MAG: sigma-54-dependent transcriptional regulator [Candidatus Tectimicrobiota bacterium]
MASILVVDDALSTCKAIETILSREGHTVVTATSGEEALTRLEAGEVDLLLCDVRMPGMDGLTVLRRAKAHDAGLAVVMVSGYSEVSVAVEAMQEGACDYLTKPLRSDEVRRAVQRALALRALQVENLILKHQVRDQLGSLQVVGSSPAWQYIYERVRQAAPSRATVLITGESGTGKELIARLLHRLSLRATHPLITLHTAALPASLLEAELFGYEKGAFTGAMQRKPGYFELANQGTLFLDEIGDMPMEVQVKVLRVLQDGTFQRVGGTQTLQVDVRIVAATNKDLAQEVAAERFRHDLYYRLNVINVHLPPLRERRADIPLLAAYFLRKYAQENHKTVTAIQHEALQCLQDYAWPGNVRELENVMERAVVLASGSTITGQDLALDEPQASLTPELPQDGFVIPANATLAQIEQAVILQALQRNGGNRQATARQLAIGPATLYRKCKIYKENTVELPSPFPERSESSIEARKV